jgi:hypothetical protein
MDQIDDVLQRYRGASTPTPAGNASADFEKVAQHAPTSTLSSGLAEAFRSPNTPPFGEMISDLFGKSTGEQRAGILNHLIAAAGPAAAGGLLGRLAGAFSGAAPGTQPQSTPPTVTPAQAQQIDPGTVRELANKAEQRDPSIVDRAGQFYAQHPKLVQGLGAAALALVMSHVSQRH